MVKAMKKSNDDKYFDMEGITFWLTGTNSTEQSSNYFDTYPCYKTEQGFGALPEDYKKPLH
jgi:hypothetical protein